MYKPKTFYTLIFTIILTCGINLSAQTTTPVTFGLEKPTEIIAAGHSSLLVSEAGTNDPNNGRISIVERKSGARRTLIAGLPSGLSRSGGPPTPSGPSGLKLDGRKLYLAIGQGDAVIPDNLGNEVINPNPSSKLFDSILELTLPADFEEPMSEFTLSANDQTTLANSGIVMLMNTEGKMLTIRLVVNLPDYRSERRPGQPLNVVRPSNVFGVEVGGSNLYIADASFNLVYRVNTLSGKHEILANFPSKPNPLPFGPPFYEAVPNSVHLVGDKLLVSVLTGFPFPQGASEVFAVNKDTGEMESVMNGLTAAIDVLPIPIPGDNDMFFVLEFSANMLGNPSEPGRLKLFNSSNLAAPTELAGGLISPTGIARDPETGDIFVTEIFPGRIIRIAASETNSSNLVK